MDFNNIERVFCTRRHTYSFDVPIIIEDLLAKPTLGTAMTYENNLRVYKLKMMPNLEAGEKFYVFYTLRKWDDRPNSLSLDVRSAYARSAPVRVRWTRPFGMVAEDTTKL